MQRRKNILITLMILIALVAIVSVYVFFNKRIRAMETKQQAPHSENLNTNSPSTLNLKSTGSL